MDWICRWSSAEANLARWERQPFSRDVEKGPRSHDQRDNHERVIDWEAPGPPESNGVARRLAEAILRFDVFPPEMLKSVVRRTPVEVGDTLGLQYRFMPGIDLFFAARVIDRFENLDDDRWCSGFTYRTIQGHPECGEETFIVEKDLATGKTTAALRSWSRPGLWMATLTYPIVRRLQLRAGRAALDHLERLAHPIATSPLDARRPLMPRRDLRTGLLRSNERW
jgi:Domain of unknown function (DUF1990)